MLRRVLAPVALALAAPAGAAGEPAAEAALHDRAYETPVAKGGATAQTAVSGVELAGPLAKAMKRSNGTAGAFVADGTTGQVLFSRGASRRFQIASNMKLFTTATALARLGPDEQFETALVAESFANGVVAGDLVLRGGGDPSLTGQGIARLAAEARAAGLAEVTGRLLYDESAFDRRRTIPRQGIRGGPFSDVGRLSALSYESGRPSDPARAAALAMIKALRKAGVKLSKKTGRGTAPSTPEPIPPPGPGTTTTTPTPVPVPGRPLAEITSSPLSAIAKSTNTFSLNFYAEMLVKAIADAEGTGTTPAGVGLIKGFAASAGSGLRAVNGSGLSRADRASPQATGALLLKMLNEEDDVRNAFLSSLAVAGGTGTLARRMRGTAAQGRCIGKTGTLDGVSALSGYCEVAPDRFAVFSILMNGVDVSRAHVAQDRMTALIARYTP